MEAPRESGLGVLPYPSKAIAEPFGDQRRSNPGNGTARGREWISSAQTPRGPLTLLYISVREEKAFPNGTITWISEFP